MSRHHQTTEGTPRGFPRVSGDEPLFVDHERVDAAFSPRERG